MLVVTSYVCTHVHTPDIFRNVVIAWDSDYEHPEVCASLPGSTVLTSYVNLSKMVKFHGILFSYLLNKALSSFPFQLKFYNSIMTDRLRNQLGNK